MKPKLLLFLCIAVYSLNISAQKTALFSGKDLNYWDAFEPTTGKHTNATDLFNIEDNIIRLYGKSAGYLITKEPYTNFKLTAQFRWNTNDSFTKKSTSKNSGIMYLIPDTAVDALWPAGIQFQIKEGYTGDFIFLKNVTAEINGEETTPGNSMNYKRIIDAEKPIGKWNKIEITVKNGEITQILNGKVVNKAKNPSVKSGRILLQYEGFPIDFKKIYIKKL